jgi:hypothetical protein
VVLGLVSAGERKEMGADNADVKGVDIGNPFELARGEMKGLNGLVLSVGLDARGSEEGIEGHQRARLTERFERKAKGNSTYPDPFDGGEVELGEVGRSKGGEGKGVVLGLGKDGLDSPMGSAVVDRTVGPDEVRVGGDPDNVLDSGLEEGSMEIDFVYELRGLRVGCDEGLDDVAFLEPVRVDGGPVLLLPLDALERGEVLGGRGELAGEGEDAEVLTFDEAGEGVDDSLAGVAGGADDEDGGKRRHVGM